MAKCKAVTGSAVKGLSPFTNLWKQSLNSGLDEGCWTPNIGSGLTLPRHGWASELELWCGSSMSACCTADPIPTSSVSDFILRYVDAVELQSDVTKRCWSHGYVRSFITTYQTSNAVVTREIKLFQNYFRGSVQLMDIFQDVQCRRNNFELIPELSRRLKRFNFSFTCGLHVK